MGVTSAERAQAAQLVEQMHDLEKRVLDVRIPSQHNLEQSITSLAEQIRGEHAHQLMKRLNVDVLDHCGLSSRPLKRIGYNNLAQIYDDCIQDNRRLQQLRNRPAVESAVRSIYHNVFAQVPCHIDRAQTPSAANELIGQFYLSEQLPPLRIRHKELIADCAKEHGACDTLGNLPGFFGNLFMGREQRDKIDEAIASLSTAINEVTSSLTALIDSLDVLNRGVSTNAQKCYEQNKNHCNKAIASISHSPSFKNLPAITADKAKLALELTRRFDDVCETINDTAIPSEDAERTAIRKLIANEKELDALQTLSDLSVDVLAHGGVRVGPIKKAGYITLRDLKGVKSWRLSGISGVTSETADNVIATVDDIYRSALESSVCRINVDEQSSQQTELIRQLWQRQKYPNLRNEQSALSSIAQKTRRQLNETTSKPGYANNLVMHSDRAAQFSLEISKLRQTVPKLEARAKKLVHNCKQISSIHDRELWEHFQSNAARYYAIIEKLGGSTISAVTGNLPKTLVQQISSTPLNTSLMKSTLRSYQTFGVKYIIHQMKTLIGDEMGLGKTVEAAAAMAHLSAKGETHFVVVCPLSVLVNWTREVPIHTKLRATSIHGPKRNESFSAWCRRGGVAVTTYETVSRLDWTQLGKTSIGIVVVDEAHYIKNPKAKRTQAVTQTLMPLSERAVLMSGTPLENSVEEMNELIGQLSPTLKKQIQNKGLTGNPIAYRQEISPVYLRRHRSDVLDELPKLVEKEDWCTLSPSDRADYVDALTMRNFSSMRRVGWRHGSISRSAKAIRLKEICEEAKANGAKVLVFSFFLDTIAKVQQLLEHDCIGSISGRIPAGKRQQIIDNFASSEKAVLVSQVTAGGVGLNIQAANIIVFCEPQIKPSIEDQAISRAYRMGQLRTVVVHRLLMDDTVDKHVQEILSEKRQAFENYADISNTGQESLKAIDTGAILNIIEAERERYGVKGGNTKASIHSSAGDES